MFMSEKLHKMSFRFYVHTKKIYLGQFWGVKIPLMLLYGVVMHYSSVHIIPKKIMSQESVL